MIPDALDQRWREANHELDHAKLNWRKPRMDDALADVADRLRRAHEVLAAVYTEMAAAVTELPAPVAAAATAAAEHHRREGKAAWQRWKDWRGAA